MDTFIHWNDYSLSNTNYLSDSNDIFVQESVPIKYLYKYCIHA